MEAGRRSAILWVALHATCWGLAGFGAAVVAPRLYAMAQDFGISLPSAARRTFAMMRVVEGAAVPLGLMLAAALTAEYLVLSSWRDRPEVVAASRWWLIALALLPMMMVGWVALVALRVWLTLDGWLTA